MTINLSRRGFIKSSATAATALFVGTNTKGILAATTSETELSNPFVRIDHDGQVTVLAKHFEMGQGTTTGLTTLLAEELDADWALIKTEFAPADVKKYGNLNWGGAFQGTGGSSAIANSFLQYRKAGAAARSLLVQAAAKKWGVSESQIKVEKSQIISGNKRAHFGEFVAIASGLTPPTEPKLKTPDQFNLIGKEFISRKDNSGKVTGQATFAMDVRIPGMVYASVARSPKFGGLLKSFDASEAKKITGFIQALALPNNEGVVVFAEDTWNAFKARDAIKAEWDFSAAETRSSDEMFKEYKEAVLAPALHATQTTSADLQEKLKNADQVIDLEFNFPFLAHAPMETLNCVIEPTETGVRFHDGCQIPTLVQGGIAKLLGLTPEQIEINTVYAGGSFGRRANPTNDYQTEAAMAFDLLGRKVPVKLVWSREDDIRGGYYRPMAVHKAIVGLDKEGKISAWDHRIASKSITKNSPFEGALVHDGIDHTTTEGVGPTLYNISNMALGVTHPTTPLRVLWWRSVGHTHTGFAMESLLDEIAHKTNQDPIDLRLSLLDKNDPKQKRLAGVLETLRDVSSWQKGDKRGVAVHFSFNTYVGVVADVSVNNKDIHVDKLHMAVDCGVPVNPDIIKAQMQGGAGYSLGAIMRNEVTLDQGEVVQSNFPDYEPIRMADMPEIDIHIIASADAPTGVGEPGVPPTAPAVANAIFAKTGVRITNLPIRKHGFSFV